MYFCNSFRLLCKNMKWEEKKDYRYVVNNYNNYNIEINVLFKNKLHLCNNCNDFFMIKEYFTFPCNEENPVMFGNKCLLLCYECQNIFRYLDGNYVYSNIKDLYYITTEMKLVCYYPSIYNYSNLIKKRIVFNTLKNQYISSKRQKRINMVLMLVLKWNHN